MFYFSEEHKILDEISMSSPLQSLKKNKIPLYPGHMLGNRPIPFRHPEYSEDESRLLEEITTNMVQERRKKDSYPFLPGINTSNSQLHLEANRSPRNSEPSEDIDDIPNDKELMRMMMRRINLLEQQVHFLFMDFLIKHSFNSFWVILLNFLGEYSA